MEDMQATNPAVETVVGAPSPKISGFEAGAPVSAIVPRTLDELAMVAAAIIKAGMAPDSYIVEPQSKDDPESVRQAEDRTKARILIGIMKGVEVGLPPITALSTIAIINNRPCVWGDGIMALLWRSGQLVKVEKYFEGGNERTADPIEDEAGNIDYAPTLRDFPDSFTAVYRLWRNGVETPFEGRFSVRDARRAKLWGNARKRPWIEHPKRMLQHRALGTPISEGFSDCLMGLAIREIAEDMTVEGEAAKTDTSFLDDDAPATGAGPVAGGVPASTETPLPGLTIVERREKFAVGGDCWWPEQAAAAPAARTGPAETAKKADLSALGIGPNSRLAGPLLLAAFEQLTTLGECDRFRTAHAKTIMALPKKARAEFETASANHQRGLFERQQEPPNA